jgi:hypothetical protein
MVYQAIDDGRLSAHRFGAGRGGIRVADTERRAWELNCRKKQETPLTVQPLRPNGAATRLVAKHLDL